MVVNTRWCWRVAGMVAFGACGDDESASAGDVSSASAEDGPDLTSSDVQTGDGTSDSSMSASSTTNTSASTTASTSTTTSASTETGVDTQTSDGTTGDAESSTTGFGTDTGGTVVGSCDECGGDELCVELTEYAGPADGGGPTVTYTCHDVPGGCGDTIDCGCAGHLCPGDGGGAEGNCDSDGEILYCSIAYP